MTSTFEISHDRSFLSHFITRWRTLGLSGEMVRILRESTDPYAAYGYGRYLYYANPGGNSLPLAEAKFNEAAAGGVADAYAALAQMYADGTNSEDKVLPGMYASLMERAGEGESELARYNTLHGTIYGTSVLEKDPSSVVGILGDWLGKNPDSDPLYWDLYGQALHRAGDNDGAEGALYTSIKRGNTESYYVLAVLYDNLGDTDMRDLTIEEGKAHGAVNCFRYLATMPQEEFEGYTPEQQEDLHRRIEEGLLYSIERNDRYAHFLLSDKLYMGELGFGIDVPRALEYARRGAELGDGPSFNQLAFIHQNSVDEVPEGMRLGRSQVSKFQLQALRLGETGLYELEQVAKAYVRGELPDHADEIEEIWLRKYHDESISQDREESGGEADESLGVICVYPQGFYYAYDVDADFSPARDVPSLIGAGGIDIVHYSPILERISKALCLDGCHLVMAVDRDGYARDLADNMAGTIVYGHGMEIRGTAVFLLEDERYNLMPFMGMMPCFMFIQLLRGATDGLVRQPTSEEMEALGDDSNGGFEEYDDPDFLVDDDKEEVKDNEEETAPFGKPLPVEGEEEEEEEAEAREYTALVEDLPQALSQCNLCRDTLTILYPDESRYWFMSTEDLIRELGIKEALEENIQSHGGYMIDEWQFVDRRQCPTDLRYVVSLEPAPKEE